MRNYVQPGNTITVPAPAAVLSGAVVVIGELAGVASGDAASGASLDLALVGVFDVPKVGANTFAVGAPVYYVTASGLATSTASGNTRIGTAIAAALAGAATVRVRLLG